MPSSISHSNFKLSNSCFVQLIVIWPRGWGSSALQHLQLTNTCQVLLQVIQNSHAIGFLLVDSGNIDIEISTSHLSQKSTPKQTNWTRREHLLYSNLCLFLSMLYALHHITLDKNLNIYCILIYYVELTSPNVITID